MDFSFREAADNLKSLITSVKDCLSIQDSTAKSAQFQKIMTDFFTSSTDCFYYMTLIQVFEEAAEILNTAEGKKYITSDKGRIFDNSILSSPLYTSLYYASLQMEKELKYLKSNSTDIAGFANALAKSETERSQLEIKKKKMEENHKQELDVLRNSVIETTKKTSALEEQLSKLQSQNAALSKRGKGQVEALNNEIQQLQTEIKNKAIQIQKTEEQLHQTSLILTNEINELKKKLTEAEKQPSQQDALSDEVLLSNKITNELFQVVLQRRRFFKEMDILEKSDCEKPSALIELGEVKKKLDEKLVESRSEASFEVQLQKHLEETKEKLNKIEAEIGTSKEKNAALQTQVNEEQQKYDTFNNEKIDVEKQNQEFANQIEELQKSTQEKQNALNSLKEAVEQKKTEAAEITNNMNKLEVTLNAFQSTLDNQKTQLDVATSTIQTLQNKEIELKNRAAAILQNIQAQLDQSDI